MGKFNVLKMIKTEVLNAAGGQTFALRPEVQLFSAVSTSFVDDNFYERKDDRVERLRGLIAQVDPAFVCRLAVYARREMNLRSIPLVLLVELLGSLRRRETSFDRRMIGWALNAVILRADEISEVLAYYQMANGRVGTKKLGALAQQLKIGVAEAFNRFDEYQFAKYDRAGSVRLRDALFLTHPQAKDETQQALFNKIAEQKLQVPYTWETQLSTRGNSKEVWEQLIDSGKLGYMALLRNLRNILEAGVDEDRVEHVAAQLEDRDQVKRSRQLPVRFLSAYLEVQDLEGSERLKNALEKAVGFSTSGLEFFGPGEKVLIAADVSGSMKQPLSGKGKVLLRDVGLLLASVLRQAVGSSVTSGIFGTTWKLKNYDGKTPLRDTVSLRDQANEVGTATNGFKVLEWALEQARQKYAKILFFTDCQLYGSNQDQHIQDYWKRYQKRNPSSRIYFVDLAGHGTIPLQVGDGVVQVSGFSDRVFEMISANERGESIVKTIQEMGWERKKDG